MKIDQAIIDEYLHREKNGWDTERSNSFVSIVNSIKARHPEYDLSKLVKYYMNYNQDSQNKKALDDWYGRIYTNPKSHRVKVYNNRKELIEFLLFFGFYNNIDSILNRFGYDELYIFDKEEWAAKTAIKLKNIYPDKTPYVLYKELLSDPKIQSALTDSNIDYNQALLLTSRAMPDFDTIDSIETARNFVYKYRNDFGRVRVTRHFILSTLFCEQYLSIEEIEWKVDCRDKHALSSYTKEIVDIISNNFFASKTIKIGEIIKFDPQTLKVLVKGGILYKKPLFQKVINTIDDINKTTKKTIFDFAINPYDKFEEVTFDCNTEDEDYICEYIYQCCLSYVQRAFNNYRIDDLTRLLPNFKQNHHSTCIEYIKRCVDQGKHVIDCVDYLNTNTNDDWQKIKTKGLLIDQISIVEEIEHTKSISRSLLLFSFVFLLSAQSLEMFFDDPNNLDDTLISSQVISAINNLLNKCGLSSIDATRSRFDFWLSKAIQHSSYKKICQRVDEEDYYPYREFALSLLTQAQMQTQTEEVSH